MSVYSTRGGTSEYILRVSSSFLLLIAQVGRKYLLRNAADRSPQFAETFGALGSRSRRSSTFQQLLIRQSVASTVQAGRFSFFVIMRPPEALALVIVSKKFL